MSDTSSKTGPAVLFPQEAKLLKFLQAAPGHRRSVGEIALEIFPARTYVKLRKDARKMHQRVGTVVFRLNKKRARFNIKPAKDAAGVYVLRKA